MNQNQADKVVSTEKDEFRKLQKSIKAAQRAIGLDDDTYRQMLFNQTSKRSTKEMNLGELRVILGFLNGERHQEKKEYPGKPKNMNDPIVGKMLKKIEAMLAEARRPWGYAHSIARNMFKVDRLEFCRSEQIHKIVQAMMIDAKRHGRRTA